MAFLLTGIGLIGWYHSRINLQRLVVSDWRTNPVFVGQQAVYTLQVDNLSSTVRHGLLAVASETTSSEELHLGSKSQEEMILRRPAMERGILKVLTSDIRSTFPLGIFETRMGAPSLPECIVYPAPIGGQPLPESKAGSQAHLRTESGTYTDMRRYAPGDPLSRISWKAFARFDELYTKEFDGASGQPALWLRWEDINSAGVEEKLSQLCRWLLDAHKQNREYGLELPGVRIQPATEESHLRECLKKLALFGKTEQLESSA